MTQHADLWYQQSLDDERLNDQRADDIKEDVQLNFNNMFKKQFGTLDISFDNLRVHQVQEYILKGFDIMCFNEPIKLDEFSKSKEALYIIFMLGFNKLKMKESEEDIKLYIEDVLINGAI